MLPAIMVFFTRPISAGLMILALGLAATMFVPALLNWRKKVFADAED